MRLLETISALGPSEVRVDVCALSGLEGSLDAQVRACGGTVIPVALTSPSFPFRFMQLLHRERYSVVHSNVIYATGGILALAAAAGVPVRIAQFHAMGDGHPVDMATPLTQTGDAAVHRSVRHAILSGVPRAR